MLLASQDNNSPDPGTFTDKGGYYKFPNGLIFQWGRFGEKANMLTKVYYNIPFPHKTLAIELTSNNDYIYSSHTSNSSPLAGTDTTNEYFTVNTDTFPEPDRIDYFYWFAIGY